MNYKEDISNQLQEALKVLIEFSGNKTNIIKIEKAAGIISDTFNKGGKVISCGNGGSMSDAMHFAEELTGRYRDDRKALPAVAISDAGHISCSANDFGYDIVFSRYIEAHGNKGDVLFGISTSGNSANVINAAKTAREQGMKIIGLTGKDGGKLAPLCDIEVRAPKSDYADRVQEIHIKVIHTIIGIIEKMQKVD